MIRLASSSTFGPGNRCVVGNDNQDSNTSNSGAFHTMKTVGAPQRDVEEEGRLIDNNNDSLENNRYDILLNDVDSTKRLSIEAVWVGSGPQDKDMITSVSPSGSLFGSHRSIHDKNNTTLNLCHELSKSQAILIDENDNHCCDEADNLTDDNEIANHPISFDQTNSTLRKMKKLSPKTSIAEDNEDEFRTNNDVDSSFSSACCTPEQPVDLTALDAISLDFPLNSPYNEERIEENQILDANSIRGEEALKFTTSTPKSQDSCSRGSWEAKATIITKPITSNIITRGTTAVGQFPNNTGPSPIPNISGRSEDTLIPLGTKVFRNTSATDTCKQNASNARFQAGSKNTTLHPIYYDQGVRMSQRMNEGTSFWHPSSMMKSGQDATINDVVPTWTSMYNSQKNSFQSWGTEAVAVPSCKFYNGISINGNSDFESSSLSSYGSLVPDTTSFHNNLTQSCSSAFRGGKQQGGRESMCMPYSNICNSPVTTSGLSRSSSRVSNLNLISSSTSSLFQNTSYHSPDQNFETNNVLNRVYPQMPDINSYPSNQQMYNGRCQTVQSTTASTRMHQHRNAGSSSSSQPTSQIVRNSQMIQVPASCSPNLQVSSFKKSSTLKRHSSTTSTSLKRRGAVESYNTSGFCSGRYQNDNTASNCLEVMSTGSHLDVSESIMATPNSYPQSDSGGESSLTMRMTIQARNASVSRPSSNPTSAMPVMKQGLMKASNNQRKSCSSRSNASSLRWRRRKRRSKAQYPEMSRFLIPIDESDEIQHLGRTLECQLCGLRGKRCHLTLHFKAKHADIIEFGGNTSTTASIDDTSNLMDDIHNQHQQLTSNANVSTISSIPTTKSSLI